MWKEIPELWEAKKADYDLALGDGVVVLDVVFYKLLSVALVKKYYDTHSNVSLTLIPTRPIILGKLKYVTSRNYTCPSCRARLS